MIKCTKYFFGNTPPFNKFLLKQQEKDEKSTILRHHIHLGSMVEEGYGWQSGRNERLRLRLRLRKKLRLRTS